MAKSAPAQSGEGEKNDTCYQSRERVVQVQNDHHHRTWRLLQTGRETKRPAQTPAGTAGCSRPERQISLDHPGSRMDSLRAVGAIC